MSTLDIWNIKEQVRDTIRIYLKNTNSPYWIHCYYPSDDLTLDDFPRIAIDATDRPRTTEKFISADAVDTYIIIGVFVYSIYNDEVDNICKTVETAMFKERKNFSNIQLVTPMRMSPVAVVRKNIFVRNLSYSFKIFENV